MISPRITFGIIVLNGEPFTRYCLRALYPYAYEIIVVEGAAPGAASVATPDGHSLDETLETLKQFKVNEDPDGKLRIITRDGFWSEKDEMSQAYASAATGDYLWQVDIDEFYRDEDIISILSMLQEDPTITAVSFKMKTFWGGFDYLCDGWYLRSGANIYHRLFKWGTGFRYVTHRPPTVVDNQGRDLRVLYWIGGEELARRGIEMYHYSLVFPKQVMGKSAYYQRAEWARRLEADRWAEEIYMQLKSPFRVHNVYQYPSWLEPFEGKHPLAISKLREDIENGTIGIEVRPTTDIDRLLSKPSYKLRRGLVRLAGKYLWGLMYGQWPGRNLMKKILLRVKCLIQSLYS